MFGEEYQAACNAAKGKLNLLENNALGYFMSSCMAGLFIGLGSILMCVVGGYFSAGGSYATKLISGLIFSVGLCFVVMAGAELFTGNNFVMSCAALKKEMSWGKVCKVWAVCFLGNLAGSLAVSILFALTGIGGGEEVGTFIANTAAAKMAGAPVQLFAKAILCNICVCLAVWCTIKMKTEAGKVALIICGVMTFVACGFEHSVANMTFFSIALMNQSGAAVTIGGALYNMVIVTLGNMVGGVLFVAVPYYLISRSKK